MHMPYIYIGEVFSFPNRDKFTSQLVLYIQGPTIYPLIRLSKSFFLSQTKTQNFHNSILRVMKAFLERYHKRRATGQLTPPQAPQIRNRSNEDTSDHLEESNLTDQPAPQPTDQPAPQPTDQPASQPTPSQPHQTSFAPDDIGTSKCSSNEFNLDDLPADPGLRTPISDYPPNIRDRVRRHYLIKGPCQPQNHQTPQTEFNNIKRRFKISWFKEHPRWLEYSVEKDAAYCLYCYLFKPDIGDQAGGDVFVGTGFTNWKKKIKLKNMLGRPIVLITML